MYFNLLLQYLSNHRFKNIGQFINLDQRLKLWVCVPKAVSLRPEGTHMYK